jgi:hypothetical protein
VPPTTSSCLLVAWTTGRDGPDGCPGSLAQTIRLSPVGSLGESTNHRHQPGRLGISTPDPAERDLRVWRASHSFTTFVNNAQAGWEEFLLIPRWFLPRRRGKNCAWPSVA